MLLKDNKKSLVTVIIDKMRNKGHNMDPEFDQMTAPNDLETDYEQGYDACCNDMIEAFHQKDHKKLKESLKSFISMIMDEENKEM